MTAGPARRIADELDRRGLATPARLLVDAHRPLAPLIGDLGAAVAPILGAVLGPGVFDARAVVDDPDELDRLIDELDRRAGATAKIPVPPPAELLEQLLAFVSDVLSASSLRLGVVPTLVLLGILLAFLQLVARPVSRWVTTDPGGLASVGRAMALAAEAGTDVVVSLGTAGLTRSTDALGRLQTLAALPILGHVARAAARSGVALRVLVNDPLAMVVGAATIEAAHEATATPERSGRSRMVLVGDGRGVAAGLVLTARARPEAAVAVGSLREEGLLHLEGLRSGAGALMAGTAEAAQAPTPLLATGASMVGPQPLQAAADLRADAGERSAVLAANRLIVAAVVVLVLASALSLAGVIGPVDLVGIERR